MADPADAEPHAAAAALDLARPTDDEAADPPDDEASEDRTAAREPVDAARLDQLVGHFSGGGHVAARTTGVPALPERRMPDSVLAAVAARLAVKAEAAAHVAAGGVPAATAALCERAERAGTRLWMLAPDAPAAEAASYRALAAAFDDAAAAATFLARTDASDVRFPAALRLAAEAQSALRAAFWALRHRDAVRVFVDDVDEEPDQATAVGLARVLRELDRFATSREPEPDDDPDEGPLSPDVAALAALLRGRTIAAFGGVPKPHVVERLRTAFSLADVRWEQTREHQSPAPFEAVVAQPDVELVLLFIRWCSHSFEDLKRYCEAHGKAYVRIPAGIHPNRIAHEVLSQVGDRLRARA